MSNIIPKTEPVEVILTHSVFELPHLKNDFKKALLDIWSFAVFKPILDLCATKCLQKSLIFKISNKRFFELDEGNCKTITTPIGGLFNKFKTRKNFEIAIKKIDTSVIVHEVAHMVEQACNLNITEEFTQIMISEIQSAISSKNMAKDAISRVLVKELEAYPKSQIPSELFARIYQLIAQSKEIYGFSQEFAFSYESITSCFHKTLQWLKMYIDPRVDAMSLEEVISSSARYIKSNKERNKSKWSGKRVKTFHKTTKKIGQKWSGNVKSNFDDPFA